MDGPAFGAGPFANIQWHLLDNMPAVIAALAGGKPLIDADQCASVPERFVLQLPHEFRPACIADGLR